MDSNADRTKARAFNPQLRIVLVWFGLVSSTGCWVPAPNAPSNQRLGDVICPFQALCEENGNLRSCLIDFQDDDRIVSWPQDWKDNQAAQVECLKGVNDCAGYRQCVYSSLSCTESRCQSNIAYDCENGRETRHDCTAAGLTCIDAPWVYCGVPQAICDDQPETRCDGDTLFWCLGDYPTVPFARNCAVEGKTCNGALCTDTPYTACQKNTCSADGKSLSYCFEGTVTSVGCDEVGPDFRCFERPLVGEGVVRIDCLIPESKQCDKDGPNANRCDGDHALICEGGVQYDLDCSRAGGTCGESFGGVNCVAR